jgi:hypothetical protein
MEANQQIDEVYSEPPKTIPIILSTAALPDFNFDCIA